MWMEGRRCRGTAQPQKPLPQKHKKKDAKKKAQTWETAQLVLFCPVFKIAGICT